MEESPVHARPVEQSHGSAVAIRQDGFGSEFACNGGEPAGDLIECFVPTDPLEAPFALRADTSLRIEQAVGRIFALEITADFRAQEPARYWMIGIAAKLRRPVIFHRDQHRAGIGTVQSADRASNFGHVGIITRASRSTPFRAPLTRTKFSKLRRRFTARCKSSSRRCKAPAPDDRCQSPDRSSIARSHSAVWRERSLRWCSAGECKWHAIAGFLHSRRPRRQPPAVTNRESRLCWGNWSPNRP